VISSCNHAPGSSISRTAPTPFFSAVPTFTSLAFRTSGKRVYPSWSAITSNTFSAGTRNVRFTWMVRIGRR
jgi:hypothetical protein